MDRELIIRLAREAGLEILSLDGEDDMARAALAKAGEE